MFFRLETLKFGQYYISSVSNGIDLLSLGKLRNLKELILYDNILVNDHVSIKFVTQKESGKSLKYREIFFNF